MKKIVLMIGILLSGVLSVNAQTSDENAILITPYVPETLEKLPPATQLNLTGKLAQLLAAQGIAKDPGYSSRFILTAIPTIQTKDITATSPAKHVYTVDITLYIGDGIDGKLFSTYTTTIKGVGDTEQKAYNAALRNIPVNNPQISAFITKGKSRIITYYNDNIDRMIREAQALATQKKYEEALAILAAVPSACTEAYAKSTSALAPIYQKYIDHSSLVALTKAKNLWNAHQNAETADQVAELLGQIDPSAACYKEAERFSATVGSRIKELDKREWDFVLQKQRDETSVRKAGTEAIREILLAFAKNQPQTIYKVNGWR